MLLLQFLSNPPSLRDLELSGRRRKYPRAILYSLFISEHKENKLTNILTRPHRRRIPRKHPLISQAFGVRVLSVNLRWCGGCLWIGRRNV